MKAELKNENCIFSELKDKSIFKSGFHTYVKINQIKSHTNQMYNSLNLNTGFLSYIGENSSVIKIK